MKIEIPKNRCGSLLTSEPVIVITTMDKEGQVNGAAYGSYVRVAPLIMIAISPGQHTYSNIKETGEFVVNLPGRDQLDSIMVFGRNYPRGVNEVKEAGLSQLPSLKVKPPRIAEYKAHIECRFKWEKEVGSHNLVAGEMIIGSCDEGLVDEEGHFDVVKAGVLHIVRYPKPIYISPERYFEGKLTMSY